MKKELEQAPREGWQERLVEERKQLLERTISLKKTFDDPTMLLNETEWSMLRCQYGAMREYLQALTDRCIYYGLIEAGDLGLSYSGPHKW